MRKFIGVLAILMATAGLALAETDYIAMPVIKDIQKGVNDGNQIQTLRVQNGGTIGGTLSVGGLVSAGALWVSTNGYFAMVSTNLCFIYGGGGKTNVISYGAQ